MLLWIARVIETTFFLFYKEHFYKKLGTEKGSKNKEFLKELNRLK